MAASPASAVEGPGGEPPAEAQRESLTKEALLQALADHSVEQLQEMGRRLTKSNEDLKVVLEDLEAERKTLDEETEYLKSTIDLIMKELQKLNIGACNTVEPQLVEGPLDFVGRFWEKVKPRDSAYQTSEHVGEIRKPVVVDGPTQPPTVQELTQHAQQQVIQTAERLRTTLGPLWQKTQGFLSEKQNEIVGAVAARAKQRQRAAQEQQQQQQQQQQRAAQAPKRQSGSNGSTGAGPAKPGKVAAASSSSSSGAPAPEAATAAASGAAPAEAAAPSASPPAQAPQQQQPDKGKAEVANGAAEAAAPAAPPAATPTPEEPTSTILIEAHLKVDDGSVHTLQVRAADRCKEVAQRFVQEHSLKAWFQDPLTQWLKKVENDATKFPVIIEADLQEIRKQYSKSK